MSKYALNAQLRDKLGKKSASLRTAGLIPVVLYGHGTENQNLSVKKPEFLKLFNQAGTSNLIDLTIGEAKPVKILIHDTQLDPLTEAIIHADFYQIREDEKIKAEVLLEFLGEAPAVKELGGILVKNYDEVEVECLPKDLELINKIQVDLSGLKNFNDAIHIKDLHVPPQIKILEEPDEFIVFVSEPQEEKIEEVKPIEAVEGIKKEGEAEAAKAGAAEAGGKAPKEEKAKSEK